VEQQLQHCITALKDTDQLPECQLKDQEIEGFFVEISKLRIPIDIRTSGDIRYRALRHFNPSESREVSVTVIQSEKTSMIIIDIKAMDVSLD
jgi:hypothetical protein